MNKFGLVIVDLQRDYYPGGKMVLDDIEKATHAVVRLLEAFREKRLPIIHVQHIGTSPNAPFFVKGTPGAEIHPSVAPLPNEELITKNYPNSFRETALLDTLRAKGVDTIILCGAMTNMCIDATARAANDLGFAVTVITDGCAARPANFGDRVVSAQDVHAAFLANLGAAYASLFSAEQFLTMINK